MNPPLTRYYPRYYRKMCYCIFQQMTWLGGNVKTKLWRLCRFMTQKHSQLNCKDFSNEANIIFAHFPDTFHHGRVSLGSVFPFFFFFWSLGRVFWVWMKAQSFGKVVRKRGQYTRYHHSISVSLLLLLLLLWNMNILPDVSSSCILIKWRQKMQYLYCIKKLN